MFAQQAHYKERKIDEDFDHKREKMRQREVSVFLAY
jgi:hypothetical protein